MSTITEKVKKIIVEKLGVEESAITENSSFQTDLGADSLEIVELMMEFETVFGINITDDKAETIVTVGDAIKFLEEASAEA